MRLPEILGVLKNPEALIRKFEDTASKFRASVRGDFNGDGIEDVAMISDDEKRIEVWKGISSKDDVPDPSGLRSLFFEAEDRVWTIDRVLTWLGGVAVFTTLLTRQGVLGALLVTVLWGGTLFGGDALLARWPFLWPVHVYLQPMAVSPTVYALNRVVLTLAGSALAVLGSRLTRDEERMLGVRGSRGTKR